MSKTTFSDKCRILGDFWFDYREDANKDENWKQFFEYADMGLPLAFFSDRGYASIVMSESEEIIEETWLMFCSMCNVDPDGAYITVADVFDASPQPALS
jgi:hypothetical protein